MTKSYGQMTKKQRLASDDKFRYMREWDNYKSDKNKTKKILKEQIRDALVYGRFTKNDLLKIKELIEDVGFNEDVHLL